MIVMMDSILLFSFGEMFSDFGFIIKLFLLVAIVGFLNQHIENKILKVVVVLFMAYIMLIVNWGTFGALYVVYAVLGLGISSIFVDYFFMTGMGGDHAQQVMEGSKQKMYGAMQQMDLNPNDPHDRQIYLSSQPKKKKGLFGGLFGG